MLQNLNNQTPHRRFNPLTGEWVLVSPQRMDRPWNGAEASPGENNTRPPYDPACYLCPGNTRARGKKNPQYKGIYVFENDYPALLSSLPETGKADIGEDDLFKIKPEQGICRVICYSADHGASISRLEKQEIFNLVCAWQDQYIELGNMDFINNVQIFENRGDSMGCSNPHPHGQIWAQKYIPNEIKKETDRQNEYFHLNGVQLLGEYTAREMKLNKRIIFENNTMVCLVPFWAVWPFETMILPKNPHSSLRTFTDTCKQDLAEALKEITTRYDRLFSCDFPYSMGLHQAPTDGLDHGEWYFHIHFYPPLLRSASIRKYMVGYELLGMPQRDITPERSARILREV